MFVVVESREVPMVGPNSRLDLVSPSPADYGGCAATQDKGGLNSGFPAAGDGTDKGGNVTVIGGSPSDRENGTVIGVSVQGLGVGSVKPEVSSESSSIGVPEESDDDDGFGEVKSAPNGVLGSLASLEEALPMKRGLSNHYSGKSRSFASLSEVTSVKDMEKRENPLNKRRRTMIAYNWSKKITSIPLLKVEELSNQEEEDEEDEDEKERRRRLRGIKSCLALSDLGK